MQRVENMDEEVERLETMPNIPSGDTVHEYYQDCLERIEASEPVWVQRTFGDNPRIIEYIDAQRCVRGMLIGTVQIGYSAYAAQDAQQPRYSEARPIAEGWPLMQAAELLVDQLEYNLRTKTPRLH